MIECQTLRIPLFKDRFRRVVFLDATLEIETHHVTRRHFGLDLEVIKEPLSFGFLDLLLRHLDNEMDIMVRMMLLVVLFKQCQK